MMYSSHGRSTSRYIVVDGRIVAIERISKWGHVEFPFLTSRLRHTHRNIVIFLNHVHPRLHRAVLLTIRKPATLSYEPYSHPGQ